MRDSLLQESSIIIPVPAHTLWMSEMLGLQFHHDRKAQSTLYLTVRGAFLRKSVRSLASLIYLTNFWLLRYSKKDISITTYWEKWLAGLTSAVQSGDLEAFEWRPWHRSSFTHILSSLFPTDWLRLSTAEHTDYSGFSLWVTRVPYELYRKCICIRCKV